MKEKEAIIIQQKGEGIFTYTMENSHGIKVVTTNYGAAVFRIQVPDCAGNAEDIVLSSPDIHEFQKNAAFFGATVGRVANRIKEGKAKIGKQVYILSQNEGKKHAHGGFVGFDKKIWNGEVEGDIVKFTYISPDGEEGYPGSVTVTVKYQLNEENELCINYQAKSTKDTIINLTNHTYFSLQGHAGGKIYDQKLKINGRFYLESDGDLLPTGQILNAEKTPFDFTQERKIGQHIHSSHPMIARNKGYDVTYLKEERGYGLAAVLKDEKSGRCLEVYTDYPAIHLYTGNFLEHESGLSNTVYNKHESVCLEAQRLPYACGYSHFGEIGLKAGEMMERKICYRFYQKDEVKR